MDDDFGDFTGFSQAPSKPPALFEGDPINTAVQNNETMLNNDFHLPIDNTTSQIDGGGVTSFAHFDINFDIPPPLSPPAANIHLAGGVPFDIPPLPESLSFDDFSPDTESENPFNIPPVKVPVTTAGNVTSHPNIVQPVANFSPPPIDSDWAADFGSFSIPPPLPIDIAESGAGCFETTIATDTTEVTLDPTVPQAETVLGTIESVLKADQEAALPGNEKIFGDFSTLNTITESTSGLVANTSAESSTMDFTNFASFEPPVSTNFPTSVDNKVTFGSLQTNSETFPVEDTSFANFGKSDIPPFPAFEENATGLEPLKSISSNNDSFDDFSTANGETKSNKVTQSEKDDFGSFATAKSTSSFAAFAEPIVSSSNATVDDSGAFSSGTGDDGFGDFKTSSDDAFGDFKTSSDDAFGDFKTSSSDGDFGNFTTSGNTGFGGFSSAGNKKSAPSRKPDVGSVLVSCFVLEGTLNEDLTSASKLLTQLLGANTQDKMNPDVWQSLQQCIDLTIPLYKWDSSSLRDNFYSALKVDPMLISRPSTLSVLTGHTKFADPLGGTTAAEDLMESFGFEGEVEESRRSSTSSPPIMGPTRPVSGHRATPTLLDLSLPETPGSPTGRNSFTLAEDLMGLDLNPQPHNQQLTSIQELLRNESLVVNKSKWVDSKLQEFGEGEKEKTSSQPSTPGLVKRQNTVELQLQQLGLDANKVSSFTGKRRELSLGARTVLGQLPELSFMLATDRVVQTHQYSI